MKTNRKLHAVISLMLGDIQRETAEMVEDINSVSIGTFEKMNALLNYMKGEEDILRKVDKMNLNGDFEE